MKGGWRGRKLRYEQLELQVYYWHITAMTMQTPIPDFAAARAAMIESQLRPRASPILPCSMRWRRSRVRPSFRARRVRSLMSTAPWRWATAVTFPPVRARLDSHADEPARGQRALVVGAGTGYSAAVLQAMGLA